MTRRRDDIWDSISGDGVDHVAVRYAKPVQRIAPRCCPPAVRSAWSGGTSRSRERGNCALDCRVRERQRHETCGDCRLVDVSS